MTIDVPAELTKSHGGEQFHSLGRKVAETLELWGGLNAAHRVLDIGCGPGRMAIGIGERFGWQNEYVGFDVKEADILFCQKAITAGYPNFRFHHFDVQNSHYNNKGSLSAERMRFPVEDHSRDFIFATSIFTHFWASEVQHYLNECARSGCGTVLTTWFIIDDLFHCGCEAGSVRFRFPHISKDGTRYQSPKSPLDAVGHALESIEHMHEQAGLEIVRIYPGGWTGQAADKPRHSQDYIVARVR